MLTDILIHMGADIPTGPTDIMDRRSTSGRHFIGTAAIEFTTRGTIGTVITGPGTKLKRPGDFSRPAGEKSRRLLFFWRRGRSRR